LNGAAGRRIPNRPIFMQDSIMSDAGAVAPVPTRTKCSRGGFFRGAAP
jgi:hypothetical protein